MRPGAKFWGAALTGVMARKLPRTAADLAARRLAEGVHTFRGPLLTAGRSHPVVPVSLEAWSGFALIAAANWIECQYAKAIYELGISLRDFVLLAEIAQRPGLSQATLAKRVGLRRSRVSEQLDVLDTAGYIAREINRNDLRKRRLWISSNGNAVVEEGKLRLTAIDAGWLALLPRESRPFFTAAVRELPPAT
jgi:DNA-binding MarR family transcriptional regulator